MAGANNSKIAIVNLSLSILGEESIRSFDESNKRARLSSNLYDLATEYVLSRYEWSFARTLFKMNLRAEGYLAEELKMGIYIYQIPSDCLMPIDILPRTRRHEWHRIGPDIHSNFAEAVLYYITSEVSPSDFNPPFINAVAAQLSYYLSNPLVQNLDLTKDFGNAAESVILRSIEEDAAIGSEHLHLDRDPSKDTFVDPDDKIFSTVDKSRYLAT